MTLNPSLVEWKLIIRAEEVQLLLALKPSLVEWKLNVNSHSQPFRKALETFLGGMETSEMACREGSEVGP